MAQRGQKPLSYAFKDLDKTEFQKLIQAGANDKDEEAGYRALFENELCYLGTFGLKDELRQEVNIPITLLRFGHTEPKSDSPGQVNIRMISGDHLDTCKNVAARAGIVGPEDLNLENTAITGEDFRKAIGPYQRYVDQQTGIESVSFQNINQFKAIKRRVKIIARATPEDKFLLIRGIQQQGGYIGMAGESIADAECLKLADVGFCMGTGCDVAKDHSDLVILDNNFNSIRRSFLWGRVMFDNVRKFLQF